MLAYQGIAVDAYGSKVSVEAMQPIRVQQPPVISFLPVVSMPPSQQCRQAVEATSALSEIDLRPWIEAARDFEMNLDFEVQLDATSCQHNLDVLMDTMKAQSDGKWTIQALADKIMLSKMMDNLGVPQMQGLLIVERPDIDHRDIENFVLRHLCGPSSYDVVVKPTHMSNAAGVINVSRPTPSEGPQMTIDYLAWHLKHFMNEKAGSYESAALQSTRPGFIVQPKYESVIDFKAPLEVRVVVLWGKARLAVWWWGHAGSSPHCHRNTWLVRCPAQRGELSEADTWQVIHMHSGNNPGFEKAIELFERHIPVMADLAEVIATAVGAPFLRSDFFVGSPQWGVRLNEVAYGSGIEYVNFSDSPSRPIVDDSTAIAQILQEGFAHCQRRIPAQHFLWKLGVRGHTYADMTVQPVPPHLRPPLPPSVAGAGSDPQCLALAVPEDLCATVPDRPARTPSKARASVTAFNATPLAEAQSSIQWTPRGQSPNSRVSPARRLTPRQAGIGSPRRLSQVATPCRHDAATPTAASAMAPAGSCMPLWNSGSALLPTPYQNNQNSMLAPPAIPAPATPSVQARSCCMPTPNLRSPSVLRGPQRANPSAAPMQGPGDVAWRAGYPSRAAMAAAAMAASEALPPQAHSVLVPPAVPHDDAVWRRAHQAASSATIPTALGGPGEAGPTPPGGYRATRRLPGAPSRTPPPSWRPVGVAGGDVTAALQAARGPRSQPAVVPSWQKQGSCLPIGLRTPPPARRSVVAAAEVPSLGQVLG